MAYETETKGLTMAITDNGETVWRADETQLRALARTAAEAGDLEMVEIARRAYEDGDEDAAAECDRVIAEAAAQ